MPEPQVQKHETDSRVRPWLPVWLSPALLSVMGLGMLIRAAVTIYLTRIGYIYPDEASYLDIGQNVLAGKGYVMSAVGFEGLVQPGQPTAYWGALTPLFSALLQWVSGSHLLTVRLLAGELCFVATFLLLLAYAGLWLKRRELLVLGMFVSLYPNYHFLGSFLMSESLFVPLTLASLLTTHRAQTSMCWGQAILAGVCFGLAHLTRPVLVPFEFALLAWIGWRHATRLNWAKRAAVILLCSGLCVAPWLIRNAIHFGKATMETKSGMGMWLHNNPLAYEKIRNRADIFAKEVEMPALTGANEFQRDEICRRQFLTFLKENPEEYAYLSARRFQTLWSLTPKFVRLPAALSAVITAWAVLFYVVAAIGLVVCLARRQLTEGFWLLAYISVLCTATIAAPRYRAPADGILLAAAAVGTCWVLSRSRLFPEAKE